MQQRYSGPFFCRILVDPGCSVISTGGISQYTAYCHNNDGRFTGQYPVIDEAEQASVILGDVCHRAFGVTNIRFATGTTFFNFEIYLVDLYLPILFSVANMDRMQVSLNKVRNILIQEDNGLSAPIKRQYGHPFVRWQPTIHACFTEPELRRLYRRFGHPHSTKLHDFNKLLRHTDLKDVSPATLQTLQDIERHCLHCQRFGPAPCRFKFAIRDDIDLNHSIYVYIFYLNTKHSSSSVHVLHVVDEATRFQAGLRLPDLRSVTVWHALRRCWIDWYLGPSDVLVHDGGSNFLARSFQKNADLLSISCKDVPI